MTQFMKGLDLSESFYKEIAQPILQTNFPTLRYAAAAIGYGSDTIGFDDEMSTDYTPFEDISIPQWLTFTEHRLLGATSGRVFHDDLGLSAVRKKLSYFPHELWLWMMAAQWTMIAEEEAFVGRCGTVC